MRILAAFISLALVCGAPSARAEEEDAGVMFKRIGHCMYKRNPELADKFLENSDAFAVREEVVGDWVKLGEKFVTGCVPNNISTSLNVRIVRDLLAEETYISHIRTFIETVPTPARQRIRSNNPKSRVFAETADCLAAKGGAVADALVRSDPGSKAENSNIILLKPAIFACLGETTSSSLSTFTIRRLVAEGLWVRFLGLDSANAGWKVVQ